MPTAVCPRKSKGEYRIWNVKKMEIIGMVTYALIALFMSLNMARKQAANAVENDEEKKVPKVTHVTPTRLNAMKDLHGNFAPLLGMVKVGNLRNITKDLDRDAVLVFSEIPEDERTNAALDSNGNWVPVSDASIIVVTRLE